MLFRPEMITQIITGSKTQTRRLCKPGECMLASTIPDDLYDDEDRQEYIWQTVFTQQKRLKWQSGRVYAVQPGRGKSGAWLRLDGSLYLGEGTEEMAEFLNLTCPRISRNAEIDIPGTLLDHGYTPLRIRITEIRRQRLQDISEQDAEAEGHRATYADYDSICAIMARDEYAALWNKRNTRKGTRWQDNPLVWALTFEVAR